PPATATLTSAGRKDETPPDRPPLPKHRFMPDVVIVARDDLGHEYAEAGPRGMHGMGLRFDFSMHLQPPVDLGASALTLTAPAIEWRTYPPLRQRPPEYLESGPWTFVVPLERAVYASEQANE